jgi:hypothetical protein
VIEWRRSDAEPRNPPAPEGLITEKRTRDRRLARAQSGGSGVGAAMVDDGVDSGEQLVVWCAAIKVPARHGKQVFALTVGQLRALKIGRRSDDQASRHGVNSEVATRIRFDLMSHGSPTSRCESSTMRALRLLLFAPGLTKLNRIESRPRAPADES